MVAKSPNQTSVTINQVPATTRSTAIEVENGSGARMATAASVSTPARAATSPVILERCQ